jgi:hypothetical protein
MSSSPPPLLSAEHRAWLYWFDDGLPTLVAGLGFLFAGVAFAYDHSQNSTYVNLAVGFVAMLLYCSILLFHRQMIDWLKAKITYPRTGYAQPPFLGEAVPPPTSLTAAVNHAEEGQGTAEMMRLREYRRQRVLLLCGAVALASFAMIYFRNRWACALAGVVTGLAFWMWGRKVYRLSWLVVAGFPVVGVGLTLLFGDRVYGFDRVTYFLIAAGALLVLDGVTALVGYLHVDPGRR